MNNVGKVFANMPQSPLNENSGLNNAEQVFDGLPKQTPLPNGHESLVQLEGAGMLPASSDLVIPTVEEYGQTQRIGSKISSTLAKIGRVPGLELEEGRLSARTEQQNMQQNLAKNPTKTVTTHKEASIAQTHETPTNNASIGTVNTNSSQICNIEKLGASLKEDSFTTLETSLSHLKGDPLRN
ncbi:hypothetical protein LIER_19227 [Lithospermum erythrorhizon]|uniref:Uncharacterized protein n=1 Tax=Lithospermum erythrorhizon TaxID=34254 RepID=A0AAV3QMD9_LITER